MITFSDNITSINNNSSTEKNIIYHGGTIRSVSTINNSNSFDAISTQNQNIEVNNSRVSNIQVNSNDELSVYNYGQASNTVVNGGYITAYENGILQNTTVSDNGSINVYSGGSAFSTILVSNTYMSVHDGSDSFAMYTTATDATLFVNGKIHTTILNSGADLYIYEHGIMSNTTANQDANIAISEYAQGYNTLINKGNMDVYNDGYVSHTTLDIGTMSVFNNGSAYDTIINASGFLFVESGGYVNNVTANNKAVVSVYDDGITSNVVINSGAYMQVTNGSVSVNNTSVNGGTLIVETGGVSNTTATLGGKIYVDQLGSITNTVLKDSGTVLYASGYDKNSNPIAVNTSVADNASLVVASGAIVSTNIVNQDGHLSVYSAAHAIDNKVNGGNISVYSNGYIVSTTIENGGIVTLSATGSAIDTTINSDGYLSALSNATLYDTTINDGGFLYLDQGGQLSGTINIYGGSAVIWGSAGGSVSMLGDNTQLVITDLNNGGSATTIINNFKGNEPGNSDSIVLEGVKQSDVINVSYEDANGQPNGDYVTLTLKDGSKITMNIVGAQDAGYNLSTSGNGQLVYEVCFLTGTMIRALHGEINVENLHIGDTIFTYDWLNDCEKLKRIKWLGFKIATVNPNLPNDMAGYPVRILKDAIAPNIPHKDLLVTPEHCLFFENKFIPVRMLVNEMSIFYDYSITNYTYYHIELDTHSVIWSDGALSESYLDTGNRHTFNNPENNIVLIPTQKQKTKNWNQDGAAELITNRNFVEPVFNQLLKTAEGLGLSKPTNSNSFTDDPHFYIQTENGRIIYPHALNNNRYIFAIPSDTKNLHLHSLSDRPNDTIGPFIDDRRKLGVLIGDITILKQNKIHTIDTHLTNTHLSGWHDIESHLYRWTDGNAMLPLQYDKNNDTEKLQHTILIVHIIACGPYILPTQDVIQKA